MSLTHSSMRGVRVHMYVIYDSPKDYPNQFVVRECHLTELNGLSWTEEPIAVRETWAQCRAEVALRGVTALFPRDPSDPPEIVETWV